jgi:formylglycine-generating enzyme required for sulfatase activity
VQTTPLAKEFLAASSQKELRAYLRSSEVDNLDQKALEKEVANKLFLTKERLRNLLEDEREEAQARLAASWLLEQWGEEMPMRKAEVDGEGKILLRVIEEKLPTTVVEDLGNGISLELVEIPGGEFWMGSPEEEEGSYSDERPRHEVKVSPFLIGRYPVTQAQWRAVASLTKVERDLNPEPSYFKGDSRPVECVSWYEAVEFCQRLSRATEKEYRLPSEAEWEYACRAVTSPLFKGGQGGSYPPFHFGEKISPALANYIEGARGRTTTVGRFQVANSFGLYDMHGNVWEWCADHWHESYEGAPTDGSAWLSENDNDSRLVRGGSWYILPGTCRSACRSHYYPRDYNGYLDIGFRVVRAASRTP